MSVRLRPAGAADAARLHDIARAAYGKYTARIGREVRPLTEDYAEVVSRLRVTVAERDGAVVGYVALDPAEADGFTVDNVAVDPAHQGRGVGRALLEHADAEARAAGHGAIVLYTHERMTENIALYARTGYEEYDRRRFGDDVLVFMRKPLG